MIDFTFAGKSDHSYSQLVSRVLEQEAQLADQRINALLLQELVEQFAILGQKLTEAHQQVLLMSRTDALTGIANRRYFDEILANEWSRSRRSKSGLGLILMDIDCFKLFNDHYGHAAGDGCLQKVAQAIHGVAGRPPDLVARYGGEEIVAVLPDINLEGVRLIGEKMLQAVRDLQMPHAFSKVETKMVSISMGGTVVIAADDAEPKTLIEAADRLLYHSKESGRNRLTVG
ncbi:MAG: GGDEF domain-containing protein [Magnetococcales bacterium]|nr:GGDEF domain-containing protein [Magnetococcales bacterium]